MIIFSQSKFSKLRFGFSAIEAAARSKLIKMLTNACWNIPYCIYIRYHKPIWPHSEPRRFNRPDMNVM